VIWSLSGIVPTKETIARTAYRFQETAIHTLLHHLDQACNLCNPQSVMIVWGVSANTRLRHCAYERSRKKNLSLLFPTHLRYCVDNAAMIGVAWLIQWQHTQ
jgi:tRNA A37 threonylcarbamoyltransferase TsaD